MSGKNKKQRKNNRNNKKNKIKKANKLKQAFLLSSENKNIGSPKQEAVGVQKATEDIDDQKQIQFEGDSDGDEPKKKKKKKLTSPAEPVDDKKGKKSIRQMKKEKYLQRQAEAEMAAKDHLKSQCLNYLSQWKHDRSNWKFMKAKQVWLYKNKFSSILVPETSWPLLLEYFESAKGNIHNLLLEDANKIIKQMDEWTESQQKDGETNETKDDKINKPDDITYKRARDLIQCLQ